MIQVATETGKSLCVDHNRLFSPPTLRALELLESGALGELVSVDFFQGFGLPPRMKLSQFENQWFGKLPGGLVQDLAPHCVYSLLEFVGPPVRFHAIAKRNGLLPVAPAEEVRVTVEGERILGTGTISLGAQPFMNSLTLYGSEGTARVNIDNFTLVLKKNRYSHPLFNRVFGSIAEGRQILFSSIGSTFRFATARQPRYPDILELIRRFYRSIQEGAPSPVSPEKGRATVEVIQKIVATMQQVPVESGEEAPAVIARRSVSTPSARILVTGATGFLGKALVQRLLAKGERPRALARPSMRVGTLEELGVEVVVGDAADKAIMDRAVRGMDTVVHCAGRMGSQGTWEEFQRDSVDSTKNVLEAALEVGVKRVIYVSSLGIYGPPRNGNHITRRRPPVIRCPKNAAVILGQRSRRKRQFSNSFARPAYPSRFSGRA